MHPKPSGLAPSIGCEDIFFSLNLCLHKEVEVLTKMVQGVYHGVIPATYDAEGRPRSAWVVSRPHNWRPSDAEEALLHLDLATGQELARVPVKSRSTLLPHSCLTLCSFHTFVKDTYPGCPCAEHTRFVLVPVILCSGTNPVQVCA